MLSFKKDIYKSRVGCLDCVAHDVTIDTQIWAGCNLDVSTYLNGDPIPEVTDPTIWATLTTGAWCYYNNDPIHGTIYGKLYNWYAVNDPRGLAPVGYHVPSDTEWATLTSFLGGTTVAGGAMKEAGFCHWATPNVGATNTSLFTALPGGFREFLGTYRDIGNVSYLWSSTASNINDAWARYLEQSAGAIYRQSPNKGCGLSVRLIKD
jgi:uncharacterized protein (TIGR02145 family)